MNDLESSVNSADTLIVASEDVDTDTSDLVSLARTQRVADVYNETTNNLRTFHLNFCFENVKFKSRIEKPSSFF